MKPDNLPNFLSLYCGVQVARVWGLLESTHLFCISRNLVVTVENYPSWCFTSARTQGLSRFVSFHGFPRHRLCGSILLRSNIYKHLICPLFGSSIGVSSHPPGHLRPPESSLCRQSVLSCRPGPTTASSLVIPPRYRSIPNAEPQEGQIRKLGNARPTSRRREAMIVQVPCRSFRRKYFSSSKIERPPNCPIMLNNLKKGEKREDSGRYEALTGSGRRSRCLNFFLNK